MYSAEERARLAFNDMLNRGMRNRFLKKLIGQRQNLLSFEEKRQTLELGNQHDAGLQTVAIEFIIGSVGRVYDFDEGFHPISEDLRMRWIAVAQAIYNGRELPPIEVYKLENAYYVIDGNHRVSVMKAIGQDFIEAHVIELHHIAERCQTQELPAPRFER